MVPYRGRFALRIARMVVATACLISYVHSTGWRFTWIIALLAAYLVYAVGAMFEVRFDSTVRTNLGLVIDTAYFGFWTYLAPGGWTGSTPAGWMSAFDGSYLFASAVMLQETSRVAMVAIILLLDSLLFTPPEEMSLVWTVVGLGSASIALSLYKGYVDRRMSSTMRHNVIIRSQAQGAREAERQRIAHDFHDGPLQSFISFQMRLEIIKKLLGRDVKAASEELLQLQDLCRSQVGELRGFVRSMRPTDEGVSLSASLSRMVEQFQRETGISASFSAGDFHDPAETEVSLELLQIVRETLNNIHKHSGASRLAISIGKREQRLEISAEDNGGGFPFSGSFNLEELELLRLGPVSIKRRVRMLGGEMTIDSKPGQGASLQIRIPV
ncbi:MAG TPA: sensor histidine kinase [Bryobacteraceae bacterium]|jgi:signal transduction histidine kinase|nr:sensor histidine kinase [Bryobacteraceae bacterium]